MPVAQWWNFFYMCGASSITMTGLMFVAVTLGWRIINEQNLAQVNVFLSPFCFHFLHIFFLCCMMAVPIGNTDLIAGSAILSAFIRLIKVPEKYLVLRSESKRAGDIELSDWVAIVILPTIVYLGLVAAGIGFCLGKPWAICTLAVCCLTLLLGSARGAWDMLVWIATNLKE
jgi:hypothetical protein